MVSPLNPDPRPSNTDMLSAVQNAVTAINNLKKALDNIFPQASATSSIVPSAGGITFSSSQPRLFMTIITSSGGSYKVPLYTSS